MTYELTIEPLGEVIEVDDEQTLLDAALRAGVWLPHACCHGLCATCKVQVVDGEVEIGELESDQRVVVGQSLGQRLDLGQRHGLEGLAFEVGPDQ